MSVTRYNPYAIYTAPPGTEILVRVIDHKTFYITVHYVNVGDNIRAITRTHVDDRVISYTEEIISEIDIMYEAKL